MKRFQPLLQPRAGVHCALPGIGMPAWQMGRHVTAQMYDRPPITELHPFSTQPAPQL